LDRRSPCARLVPNNCKCRIDHRCHATDARSRSSERTWRI